MRTSTGKEKSLLTSATWTEDEARAFLAGMRAVATVHETRPLATIAEEMLGAGQRHVLHSQIELTALSSPSPRRIAKWIETPSRRGPDGCEPDRRDPSRCRTSGQFVRSRSLRHQHGLHRHRFRPRHRRLDVGSGARTRHGASDGPRAGWAGCSTALAGTDRLSSLMLPIGVPGLAPAPTRHLD